MSKKQQIVYSPWHRLNALELLVDGHEYYESMLLAIQSAKKTIFFETYLFRSGKFSRIFIAAIRNACRRGVKVYVMLDDIGAMSMSTRDRGQLSKSGAELHMFNHLSHRKWLRNLARNHRKLLIVDSTLAFMGGAGIADEFSPEHCKNYWHDIAVKIEGSVVNDLVQIFSDVWLSQTGEMPNHEIAPVLNREVDDEDPCWARIASSNGRGKHPIKAAFIKRIREAKHTIWLCTAYFFPSWKIKRALRRAAMRGVNVNLLLPGIHTDHPSIRYAGRAYYASLLKHGVKIYEYQPRFLHMKVAIADDWVMTGSCNMDRWSLHWNIEANLEVDNKAFTKEVFDMLDKDLQESLLITHEAWQKRPLMDRLYERLCLQAGLFIERLTYRD